jgi:ribosomal protein S27E
MPVILDTPEAMEAWLDVTSVDVVTATSTSSILKPCLSEELSWHPVSKGINKIGNPVDNETCIKPVVIGEPPKITSFFGGGGSKVKKELKEVKKVKEETIPTSSSSASSNKRLASSSSDSENNVTVPSKGETGGGGAADNGDINDDDRDKNKKNKKMKSENQKKVACPQCTFHNDDGSVKCEVCGGEIDKPQGPN